MVLKLDIVIELIKKMIFGFLSKVMVVESFFLFLFE